MPSPMIWDLDTPTSNVALERIRQALLGIDDVFLVLDALLGMLDDAAAERAALRTELDAATADRQQLRADLDALTARLDALSPPPPDLEAP